MITRKKKKCKNCETDQFLFSHGLCLGCWKILKGSKIPLISDSEKERRKRYELLRAQFLKQNQICEVCKIKPATEIHHKGGRIGENLFNDLLAVDRDCHRQIEENPDWAREQGYVISRL